MVTGQERLVVAVSFVIVITALGAGTGTAAKPHSSKTKLFRNQYGQAVINMGLTTLARVPHDKTMNGRLSA